MDVCRELLECFEMDLDFLRNIVTEFWMYYYDLETKQQSSQWKGRRSSPPVKANAAQSAGKVMMVIFFDYTGFIYQYHFPRRR